jgi:hypothetical protein
MELSEWHLWFKRRGGRELRDLVMREWDPIGVSDAPEARDEYDGYLGRIAERLRREAPAEEIAELLGSFRTADMGLRSDSPADRRVAEILIAWYTNEMATNGRAEEAANVRAEAEPTRRPALTRSDAWLLAALTEGSHDGRPVTLPKFVHDADWLNRDIPTFDEISFGFPRLLAHGLMTVDGLRFRAPPRAIALRKSIKAGTLGGVLMEMAENVGARPYPEPEVEDRSLGELPGLIPPDLDAAVRKHSESMEPWIRVISGTIRAAELVSRPLLAAKRGVRRIRARRRS